MRRTETALHTNPPLDINRPIKINLTRPPRQQEHNKPSRAKAKSLSPVKKPKITDNPKIVASLRYQLVSLMNLLGRREDFMGYLKGKEMLSIAMKPNEIEERLVKLEESKGKDRGRVKFNHITN